MKDLLKSYGLRSRLANIFGERMVSHGINEHALKKNVNISDQFSLFRYLDSFNIPLAWSDLEKMNKCIGRRLEGKSCIESDL